MKPVYNRKFYSTCSKCNSVYMHPEDAETCADSKCPAYKDGLPNVTKWIRLPHGWTPEEMAEAKRPLNRKETA
jgi:hypothetical protein